MISESQSIVGNICNYYSRLSAKHKNDKPNAWERRVNLLKESEFTRSKYANKEKEEKPGFLSTISQTPQQRANFATNLKQAKSTKFR